MKKPIIAATALLAGTAALAQTAPAPVAAPAPMAHPMHDKVMTRTEAVQKVREHFGKLDGDRNGSITKEEVMSMRKHPGGAWQGESAMAKHHEAIRDPNAAFDRMDANKDGSISRDEFTKAREQRVERRVVMREGGKDAAEGARPGGRRGFRMGGMGGARMLVMADTNSDGQVTLAEAEAMALQHFDQMDSNKDGQVTPEERRAGRPMIIKRMVEEPQGDS